MKRSPVLVFSGIVALIAVFASSGALIQMATDWYWFQDLGFEPVFLKSLGTRAGIGGVIGLVAFGFLYINLVIAQRGVVPDPIVLSLQRGSPIELTHLLRRLSWPAALFASLLFGVAASSTWLVFLRFFHRTPFAEVDPVFGRDVGYYVFTLPAISVALRLVVAVTVIALALAVPLYLLRRDIVVRGQRLVIEPSAENHVASLIALFFATTAASTFLVRIPSLLYSATGPLFGASYTDLAMRLPLLRVVGVLAVVGAVLVIVGARTRRLTRNTAIAAALYFGVTLVGEAAAAGMQKFVVDPNELVKESPQLEHHIAATRRAWGLDAVTTRDLSGEATLTSADITANSGTIRNVRLWDREPLLQTFQQLQEIRTYYDFVSVDDDRYWIDGQYRQVLLSVRELNPASLPTRNFINEHLTYTHGMGLTLSPVNQVSQEGLPSLFIKDLPPQSSVSIKVTRPGVYFGELTNNHVFVRTQQAEIDYPLGDSTALTTYENASGVLVTSFLRKLLLSLRFGSFDMLFTDLITSDSRVLYHRNIMDRARKALPFLLWDADPYIVITEAGHLKWILDAYTASDRYPYSQPIQGGTNYLRNSVKVVIDAYDGSMQAYISEPRDPIVQTYARIFAGVLLPLDSMPADLRAHLRYPMDLFRIQTAMYSTYHMDEPGVFYAREDQWQIPGGQQGAQSEASHRHMVMKLPGETREEYISMTPFTPRQKDNLAAWMVARSDGAQYGQLVVYRFPRQSLLFGPTQISNRINQDTEISRQISLWDQRGSEVIRGNLLVIPIAESLIFVQSLYLRAEGGKIPELKRVIVAYQNQVVMEETLALGLARLFGGRVETDTPVLRTVEAAGAAAAAATGQASSAEVSALVREASMYYREAIAAQQVGDWARYGERMRLVGERLQRLQAMVGGSGRE